MDQPIPLVAGSVVVLIILAVLAWVVLKGYLPYLWREWITSVDHKRIGIMYIVLGIVMLLRGFADAIMMRSQQAIAFRAAGLSAARALRPDLLRPRHDHDLLRGHAARHRPHEFRRCRCSSACATSPSRCSIDVSFWLTATGALLVNISLFVGEFARTGWLRLPAACPSCLTRPASASITTCGRCRSPGSARSDRHQLGHHHPQDARARHELLRMPMFCWTALASNLLIVAAFPVLTATSGC